jgi:hypothetical protein
LLALLGQGLSAVFRVGDACGPGEGLLGELEGRRAEPTRPATQQLKLETVERVEDLDLAGHDRLDGAKRRGEDLLAACEVEPGSGGRRMARNGSPLSGSRDGGRGVRCG